MLRLSLISALLLAGPAPDAAAEDAFRVIVNAQLAGAQISRESLVAIFLRKGARWPDGRTVQAVDLSARSSVRAAFCERVLAMDLRAVQSHWLREISGGKGAPPPVKASDAEVVAFVAANPAAIGYVSAGAELAPGVRPIRIVE